MREDAPVEVAYQGVGFNGYARVEERASTSEAATEVVRCPSCSFEARLLPSRRPRCPRCKTDFQARGRGFNPAIGAIIAVVLLLLVAFYVQGSFDHFLYRIGLNWETCGQGLTDGKTACGDEFSPTSDPLAIP